MENRYENESSVLDQAPGTESEQIKFMHGLRFRAVARKGSWVMWEMEEWPEVFVWLQNFQTDLSTRFIMMQIFRTGIESGKVFQVNEFRLNLGLPVMPQEDAERLSAFGSPWLACELNPRHGRHES